MNPTLEQTHIINLVSSGNNILQAEKLQRNRKVEYQWSSLASYIKLEEM